jgi:hypothetical protein
MNYLQAVQDFVRTPLRVRIPYKATARDLNLSPANWHRKPFKAFAIIKESRRI